MVTRRSLESSVALADIFPPESVVIGLKGSDKPALVRQLVARLVELGRIAETEAASIVEAILTRETRGSIVFGSEVATFNCRTDATDEFIGAVGFVPEGVSFEANGKPVYEVFLLVAPLNQSDRYYEVLGRVAALGADKTQRLMLRGCRTPNEVHHLLREMDR